MATQILIYFSHVVVVQLNCKLNILLSGSNLLILWGFGLFCGFGTNSIEQSWGSDSLVLLFPQRVGKKQSKTLAFAMPLHQSNGSMESFSRHSTRTGCCIKHAFLDGQHAIERMAAAGYVHSFDSHRRDHRTDQTFRCDVSHSNRTTPPWKVEDGKERRKELEGEFLNLWFLSSNSSHQCAMPKFTHETPKKRRPKMVISKT